MQPNHPEPTLHQEVVGLAYKNSLIEPFTTLKFPSRSEYDVVRNLWPQWQEDLFLALPKEEWATWPYEAQYAARGEMVELDKRFEDRKRKGKFERATDVVKEMDTPQYWAGRLRSHCPPTMERVYRSEAIDEALKKIKPLVVYNTPSNKRFKTWRDDLLIKLQPQMYEWRQHARCRVVIVLARLARMAETTRAHGESARYALDQLLEEASFEKIMAEVAAPYTLHRALSVAQSRRDIEEADRAKANADSKANQNVEMTPPDPYEELKKRALKEPFEHPLFERSLAKSALYFPGCRASRSSRPRALRHY